MATVEIVTLTDSLDERIKNGVETVTFFHPAFGTKHEIELSEKNREHFASHLAKLDKYIDASREVVEVAPATVKPAAKSDNRNAVIRAWAQANGYAIGDRGRIKADIVEAYDKAQSSNDEPAKLVAVSAEAPELEDVSADIESSKTEDEQAQNDLQAAIEVEQEPDTDLSDEADPTAKMSAEEFEAFILGKMDADGNISAEALAQTDSNK